MARHSRAPSSQRRNVTPAKAGAGTFIRMVLWHFKLEIPACAGMTKVAAKMTEVGDINNMSKSIN